MADPQSPKNVHRHYLYAIVAVVALIFALSFDVSALPVHAENAQPLLPKRGDDKEMSEIEKKIEAQRQREIAEAKKVLSVLDGEQRELLIGMHWLLPWPRRHPEDLPRWRRDLYPPRINAESMDAKKRLPPWAPLRITALLRAGYPVNKLVTGFYETLCEQPLPEKGATDWCRIVPTYMALDAALARKGEFSESLAKKIDEYGAKVSKSINWDVVLPPEDQDGKVEREDERPAPSIFCEALCRQYAVIHNWKYWKTLPNWDETLTYVEERVSQTPCGMIGYPFSGGVPGANQEAQHRAVFLTATLALALRNKEVEEGDLGTACIRKLVSQMEQIGLLANQKRIAREKAQRKEEGKKPLETEEEPTNVLQEPWIINGGLMPLMQLLKDIDLGKTAAGNLSKLKPFGFDEQYRHYPYRLDSGIGYALGWHNRNILMEDQAENEELVVPHTGFVATALCLIGKTGGFFAKPSRSLLNDEDKFQALHEALAYLEQNEVDQYDLKSRVDRALASAGEFLLTQQAKDGKFKGDPRFMKRMGHTALCVLALLDAGVPRDHAAVQKGIDAVLTGHPLGRGASNHPMYDVAIALMMFQRYYEPEQKEAGMLEASNAKAHKKAAGKVKSLIRKHNRKHWTYLENSIKHLTKKYVGRGWNYQAPTTGKDERADNSLGQYGVLGIKSASLLGLDYDQSIIVDEAKRWLEDYVLLPEYPKIPVYEDAPLKEKKKSKRSKKRNTDSEEKKDRQYVREAQPGWWPYNSSGHGKKENHPPAEDKLPIRNVANVHNLTPGGVSSLAIIRDELRLLPKPDEELYLKCLMAMQGGLYTLGQEYPFRDYFTIHDLTCNGDGMRSFYGLYGVERACVLSGTLHLGKIEWYREGAMLLIQSQDDDGRWSSSSSVSGHLRGCDHSFAILFLRAAAIPTPTLKRDLPITGKRDDNERGEAGKKASEEGGESGK